MYGQRRRILSQNFLHSRALVNNLVRRSSIGKKDTVLDIGAGRGIITSELLDIAQSVIAIEVDNVLCEYLYAQFRKSNKFRLVCRDILKYRLPKHPYKVFANIPFSIEGKIIRKLLNAPNPPSDAYLVMRADLAHRLLKKSQFAIFYQPWFDFSIEHHFHSYDFKPAARMETVLLRFEKKKYPLLSEKEKKSFQLFIGQGFGGGKYLRYNLRSFLSDKQFRRRSNDLGFDFHSNPTSLSLEQWIGLWKYLSRNRDFAGFTRPYS